MCRRITSAGSIGAVGVAMILLDEAVRRSEPEISLQKTTRSCSYIEVNTPSAGEHLHTRLETPGGYPGIQDRA